MAALRGQDSRRDAQGEVSEHAAGSAGCSQLEDGIPALPSCFPRCCTTDPHRARGAGAGPKSKHTLTSRGGRRESRKQVCPSRFPPPQAPLPHPAMAAAGLDISQHRSGQKIHLPASLARDERTGTHSLPWLLKDIQSRSHSLEHWILHEGANASPTLQLKCQTSDLLHSRVLSLLSSPSLCQHDRAVEIQPPFPGE